MLYAYRGGGGQRNNSLICAKQLLTTGPSSHTSGDLCRSVTTEDLDTRSGNITWRTKIRGLGLGLEHPWSRRRAALALP